MRNDNELQKIRMKRSSIKELNEKIMKRSQIVKSTENTSALKENSSRMESELHSMRREMDELRSAENLEEMI